MKKKLCIITSTRADYGFFKPLITQLKNSEKLELSIIATGTHLEEKYGKTIREVEADVGHIDAAVPIICNDTPVGIIETMANAVKKIGDELARLKPDMVAVLGDRYEIFAAISSCPILNIPVAHISGGDVTYGAYDDVFRHCITKISYLHFTSCEEYRDRVIQLGEEPHRVFSVGSVSVENIKNIQFLSQAEIEKDLDLPLKNVMLTTFHPTTLEGSSQAKQFQEFLSAIAKQNDYKFLFTMPNADTNREELVTMLMVFAKQHPEKVRIVDSLGTIRYFSVMKYCAGVIGNSSSGIVEAPSMKKGSINIGNRQKGRVCTDSVINCEANEDKILEALQLIASADFQKKLLSVRNPYEQENTSAKIIAKIEEVIFQEMPPKKFFDLPK